MYDDEFDDEFDGDDFGSDSDGDLPNYPNEQHQRYDPHYDGCRNDCGECETCKLAREHRAERSAGA